MSQLSNSQREVHWNQFMLQGLREVIDNQTMTPLYIKIKLEQIIQELSEINPMCQWSHNFGYKLSYAFNHKRLALHWPYRFIICHGRAQCWKHERLKSIIRLRHTCFLRQFYQWRNSLKNGTKLRSKHINFILIWAGPKR